MKNENFCQHIFQSYLFSSKRKEGMENREKKIILAYKKSHISFPEL